MTEVWIAIIGLAGVILGSAVTGYFSYKTNKVKAASEEKINEENIKAKDIDDKINDILESMKKQEESLTNTKSSIHDTLKEHREEYLNGINKVEDQISKVEDQINDMKAAYQETVSTVTIQIDNLQKETEKHNKVIERTYKLESKTNCHDVEIDNIKQRITNVEKEKTN